VEEEASRERSREIGDCLLPQKEEGGHQCRDEEEAWAIPTAGFEVQSAGAVGERREGGRERRRNDRWD